MAIQANLQSGKHRPKALDKLFHKTCKFAGFA